MKVTGFRSLFVPQPGPSTSTPGFKPLSPRLSGISTRMPTGGSNLAGGGRSAAAKKAWVSRIGMGRFSR